MPKGLTDEEMGLLDEDGISDEEMDDQNVESEGTIPAIISGTARGLTGGFSDELAAAAAAGVDVLKTGEDFQSAYARRKEEQAKRTGAFEKQNPVAYGASTFGGALYSPINKLIPNGTGLLGAGKRLAGAAASSAIQGVGEAEGDLTDRLSTIPQSAYTGAGFQLLGDAVFKGAPSALRRGFTGITGETADYYRKNREAVNKASFPELFEDVRQEAGKFKTRADEYGQLRERAKDRAERASDKLEKSFSGATVPEEMIESLPEKMKQLVAKNSKMSSDAFEFLATKNVRFETAPLIESLRERAKSIAGIGRGVPPGSEADSAMIQQWMRYVGGQKTLSAVQMKQLIRNIDAMSGPIYEKMGKAPLSISDKAILDLRRAANKELLSVPGYDKLMAPLRKSTAVAEAMEGLTSDPKRMRKFLERAALGKYPEDAKLLSAFGQEVGEDFGAGLQDFATKRTKASDKYQMYDEFNRLPEQKNLQQIEEALQKSKEDLEKVSPFVRDPEPSLRQLMRAGDKDKKLLLKERLDYLSKQTGKDYGTSVKNVGIKEMFDKPFVQGSRNVNLGAFSLRGLADALTGGRGGDVAAAAGAAMGGGADVVGPKAWKAIVDAWDHPRFAPYANVLSNAARKSPMSFVLTFDMLKRNNPEFNEMIGQ